MADSLIPTLPPFRDVTAEQTRLKAQVDAGITELLTLNRDRFDALFNAIWRDTKLTPQQAFDAFGSQAAALFQFAGKFQTFFNELSPNLCPQEPPLPYTINADGTVAIG